MFYVFTTQNFTVLIQSHNSYKTHFQQRQTTLKKRFCPSPFKQQTSERRISNRARYFSQELVDTKHWAKHWANIELKCISCTQTQQFCHSWSLISGGTAIAKFVLWMTFKERLMGHWRQQDLSPLEYKCAQNILWLSGTVCTFVSAKIVILGLC